MKAHNGQMLVVDGKTLSCDDVGLIAYDQGVRVEVAPEALARAEEAWKLVPELQSRRPVYGRTTGVGANRDELVDAAEAAEHGRRLMRSHAGGTGEEMTPELVRAMLLVRLNQLAAGRAGVNPRLLTALAEALTAGAIPRVHRTGSIGTGDLTVLAETGLTLAGERPWASGSLPPVPFDTGDALAFQSSNAATLAEAVLGCLELG